LAPLSNNNQPPDPDGPGLEIGPRSNPRADDTSSAKRWGRWGAVAGLFVGYALLSQYSASSANPYARTLGAALSIGPVFLIGLLMLWLWRWRLVALFFARSLVGSRVPVCAQLAHQMYGTLTPDEIAYMRRATMASAIFYFLLSTAILVLFFVVPLRVWSVFANFVTWGLMVLAGFLDHALRRIVLPRHQERGILTLIRRALST
jgi:hypothetical protein